MTRTRHSSPDTRPLGIAAIAAHQPAWSLPNAWFGDIIPRKFVHHTGIESRYVSVDDEVTLGVRAVKQLQLDTGCDLARCAGIIFASPSFIPPAVARQHLSGAALRDESLKRAARRLARRLGIADCPAIGINWFCSGYSRALSLATSRLAPVVRPSAEQFLLVITSSRISRITDYSCKQTGALFGDLATATLVTPLDSPRHPVHFEILLAQASKQPAEGVFFDFHKRQGVLAPVEGGGRTHEAERLVFSLDGMGIADVAPRAMAAATAEALAAAGLSAGDVQFVVPHQAGAGIVRFTAAKLDTLGVQGEVISGITADVGNVSSGSIPLSLLRHWSRLSGVIACPTAAVGNPGQRQVSQGCILLRATSVHEQQRQAA
jgi:3-oxoacyl-[acyl-carrier-protein] synthase III